MKNKVKQSIGSSRKKRLSCLEIQNELLSLEERFLQDLKTGKCKPGSLLPSLHQLEEVYGVSYHLARQFYSRLEERGILLSVRGKGFFLANIPDGETILPNMLLYRRGILAVGKIDMTRIASALNSSFCWLSELEKACLDLGIPFRFANLYGQNDSAELKFRDLLDRIHPAGVIFLSPDTLPLSREELKHCPLPSISLTVTSFNCPEISVDEEGGARQAVKYLLKEGYRRIGYLAYPDSFHWQEERLKGYAEAMEEAGIERNPEWIVRIPHPSKCDLNFLQEAVEHAAEQLFPQCDAMLCGSDIPGVICLEYAKKHGLQQAEIPALIGFDNLFEVRAWGLSSVAPAWEQQSREALHLLMEWIVQPDAKRVSRKIAGRLYIRNSSFKPDDRM